MRTILDTNLFISYLASSNRVASATGAILDGATLGAFTLLFAAEIAEEIARTIANRPDLTTRIVPGDLAELLDAVEAIAEMLPALVDEAPHVGRDRKDDYLIALAVLADADYLVSWDKDLRDLRQVDGVRIVSPPEFLRILRETGRLDSAGDLESDRP